jgi:hypothetical protein
MFALKFQGREREMRKTAAVLSLCFATLLMCSPIMLAQTPGLEVPLITPGPGWKTCPRCENPAHIADDRAKANVDTRPFDVHDISGVWGDDGIELDVKTVPPFTPYGQKLFDATTSTVRGVNSKDPMNVCDPLGYPRAFAYNYGVEFAKLPDRVLQFFEFQHTYRTIWTDGRKLPVDPPVYRYLGYSVGHWEGDEFVVESSGFDDRSWLSEDRRHRIHGFPHTTELKVEERYKRLNYGKLQATLTIIDPKVFTKPWVTTGIATLRPNAELAEYFCVPSEETTFNSKSTLPSTGSHTKTLGH